MKTLSVRVLAAILFILFIACSGQKNNTNALISTNNLRVFGPGSSPDTISVPPSGGERYFVVYKKATGGGPGSSPDTITVKANETLVIYKTIRKPKGPGPK